jgi:hypothetical protein
VIFEAIYHITWYVDLMYATRMVRELSDSIERRRDFLNVAFDFGKLCNFVHLMPPWDGVANCIYILNVRTVSAEGLSVKVVLLISLPQPELEAFSRNRN